MSILNKAVTLVDGLYTHEKPEDLAGVDEYGDITKLSSQQLGRLNQYFTNQHSYMLVELAKADQQFEAADHAHKTLKAQLTIVLSADKQTKYELDAKISQRPEVIKSYHRVMTAKAYKEVLSATVKGVENKGWLAQREITRRSSERDVS